MKHKTQKRFSAVLTTFVFIFNTITSPVLAATTYEVEGGKIEENDAGNEWRVTGNPVWDRPEFNVAADTTHSIIGLTDTASLALRVTGGSASNIFGTLSLTNIAFILQNIFGIHIGAAGKVTLNNASLLASTIPLNLSATDFLKQNYQFSGQGGFLSNEGSILGGQGDLVALIANALENRGTIEVPMGTVALAAGKTVTIGLDNSGLISVGVDPVTADEMGLTGNPADQIKNTGVIRADNGKILMTAKAADTLFDKAINLTGTATAAGVIQADNGRIELVSMDDIYNDAILQAMRGEIKVTMKEDSPPQEAKGTVPLLFTNAGTMETDTGKITVDAGASGTVLNTGTIRTKIFDEKGYSFRSTGSLLGGSEGGKYQYANVDGAANLSGDIGADQSDIGNLIVLASGPGGINLTADDLVFTADSDGNGNGIFTMEDGATLTGNGYNLTIYSGQNRSTHSDVDPTDDSAGAENSHFEITSGINRLTLNSSNSSDTTYDTDNARDFSVTTMATNYRSVFTRDVTDGDGYHMIYSASNAAGGLQNMLNHLGYDYKLANNIDASETSSWNEDPETPGTYFGFTPVGQTEAFNGTFDGDGHTITGLTINRPDENNVGLFGMTGHVIKNVGLIDISIMGNNFVGGLAGVNGGYSSIDNSYATGTVNGSVYVGGLAGISDYQSAINDSYFIGDVTGTGEGIGGLAGTIGYRAVIDNSYFSGDVNGGSKVGGLVGYNYHSTIDNSYAEGTVTGTGDNTGGLVGNNGWGASISNSFSSAIVTGDNNVGGLVGFNFWYASIDNSYAAGDVSGSSNVGGLVGYNHYAGASIDNSYATGVATATGEGQTPGGLIGVNNGVLTNNLMSIPGQFPGILILTGSRIPIRAVLIRRSGSAPRRTSGMTRVRGFGPMC